MSTTPETGGGGDVEVEFARNLSLFDTAMIGIGATIGAGIFVLTGLAVQVAGPLAIIAFALNGLVALLTALAYAELSSAYPESGGGAVFIRKALPPPFGFLSAWLLWFAYIAACTLYARAFGSYLLELFHELGWYGGPAYPFVLGVAVMITIGFVALNLIGTHFMSRAENTFTIAKIMILGVFILAGLWWIAGHPALSALHFGGSSTVGGMVAAMGLTFIAFEGFDLISTVAEEIKDPQRNIPRAIFISLGVSLIIYLLVIFVALARMGPLRLGSGGEVAMVEAAVEFFGTFGFWLMLTGGFLATMSALNATMLSSSRVSFAMGREGFLPRRFAVLSPRFRTPVLAVVATGVVIIIVAGLPDLNAIASGASVIFLLIFALVNLSLIILRIRDPDTPRSFKVPFFPYLPIAGLVVNLAIGIYLPFAFDWGRVAWVVALAWVFVGLAGYWFIRGEQAVAIALRPRAVTEGAGSSGVRDHHFRVLVALSHLEDRRLVALAHEIVVERDGDLVLLHGLELPPAVPLSSVGPGTIRPARERMAGFRASLGDTRVHIRSKVVLTHEPAEAVMQVAKEMHVSLVIAGWGGRLGHRRIFSHNVDRLLQEGSHDVMVVSEGLQLPVERILVFVTPSTHLSKAVAYLAPAMRAWGSRVNLLGVAADRAESRYLEQRTAQIAEILITAGVDHQTLTIIHKDPVDAVVERTGGFDLLVIGAGEEWIFTRYALGATQDQIARRANCPVLMLRHVRDDPVLPASSAVQPGVSGLSPAASAGSATGETQVGSDDGTKARS